MDLTYINLGYEDELSERVLKTLLSRSGRAYVVGTCYTGGGFGYLKSRISGFNNAAKGTPFLILTDLDTADCAPSLMREWLPTPKHPHLLLRVAVREVEAWLIADREQMARFLGVQVDLIPQTFDAMADPKAELIRLARLSPKREVRADIVPRPNSTSQQGPDYNARMAEFVERYWRPDVAALHSLSLRRTVQAIVRFRPQGLGSIGI